MFEKEIDKLNSFSLVPDGKEFMLLMYESAEIYLTDSSYLNKMLHAMILSENFNRNVETFENTEYNHFVAGNFEAAREAFEIRVLFYELYHTFKNSFEKEHKISTEDVINESVINSSLKETDVPSATK